MTLVEGVCYVCWQPKAEHTDAERRLGCHRPLGFPPSEKPTTEPRAEEEAAF
jgi:hypothetical protein